MEKKNNRQILIKVCCVIASFCLWLYISNWENPISTYTLKNVSVELINSDSLSQSNLTLAPNQKFSVPITIRGTNLEVMKSKASDFTIVADMSVYAVKQGENRIPVNIVHYPDNVNIQNSNNMWIDVEIDKLSEKTVPVKVKLQGKPKYGYYYLEPTSSQGEVAISGPSKSVDLVSNVIANANIDSLNANLDAEEVLEAVDKSGKSVPNIIIKPQKIQVTVPIKKNETVGTNAVTGGNQTTTADIKSKTVSINVLTSGKQSTGVDIKSIASVDQSIQITGTSNEVDGLTSINTEPIDLSSITGAKTMSVKLALPSGVTTINGTTTVNVKINVDTIIQKTFSANISLANLPDGFTSTLDNNAVNVIVSGDSTIINAIKSGDISGTIDATSFKEGLNNAQPVLSLPQGVKNMGATPNSINVTLTKK